MTAVVRDAASGRWRLFERPWRSSSQGTLDEVLPALERVETACARDGGYAAGFLSYEAAPAFDASLTTQPPDDFPLLWFGIYDTCLERTLEELGPPGCRGIR